VLDGDTVSMSGQSIRLWGVDAPEQSQRCENHLGQSVPCGHWATHRLDTFLAGRVIRCEQKGEHGGRVVAHCFVDGVDINDWLVREGIAVAVPHFTPRFVGAEASARQARRGIWEGRFERPSDFRASRKISR